MMKRQAALERIRGNLLKRRRQLLQSANTEMHELRGQFDGQCLEDNNEAADTEAATNISCFVERITGELERVESALKRLDAGVYGHCEVCGQTIALERLNVLPAATSCVRCQEISEACGASLVGPNCKSPDNRSWPNGFRTAHGVRTPTQYWAG